MSTWVLWWVGGQFIVPETAPSALDVLGELGNRFGLALSPWGRRVAQAWGQLAPLVSVLGGLLWAATSERGQAPALLGWVAVMLASERLGYQPSVVIALAAMVGFILLAWLCSLANNRFVDRRPTAPSHNVLRAGVSAAALSAVVPLFAPGVFVFRLCRPYVATAPGAVPAGRGSDGGRTGVPEPPDA
ncbi:hypothetical protein [Halopolyspora algeriensis]|uniref:hypothetical protein n=1 Tax=Halopolyspora algeriensis TaxID=1500506 RepID=UPI001FE9419C|nr:hypothetical protein [Halopolyspora algeriensis]